MTQHQQSLEDLQEIKSMMERSSRFISLSGLSGIAAGCCALLGAWFAHNTIESNGGISNYHNAFRNEIAKESFLEMFNHRLMWIAFFTFLAAISSAFLFTYLRSKKTKTPIWGSTAKRLTFNVIMPMVVGGIYILRQMELGNYELLAPGCLIFYGLALVNASKYTLGEVKYLGYCQILLGLINCWLIRYGIALWAIGFGLLHIVYGIIMYYKYEKN